MLVLQTPDSSMSPRPCLLLLNIGEGEIHFTCVGLSLPLAHAYQGPQGDM